MLFVRLVVAPISFRVSLFEGLGKSQKPCEAFRKRENSIGSVVFVNGSQRTDHTYLSLRPIYYYSMFKEFQGYILDGGFLWSSDVSKILYTKFSVCQRYKGKYQ